MPLSELLTFIERVKGDLIPPIAEQLTILRQEDEVLKAEMVQLEAKLDKITSEIGLLRTASDIIRHSNVQVCGHLRAWQAELKTTADDLTAELTRIRKLHTDNVTGMEHLRLEHKTVETVLSHFRGLTFEGANRGNV